MDETNHTHQVETTAQLPSNEPPYAILNMAKFIPAYCNEEGNRM